MNIDIYLIKPHLYVASINHVESNRICRYLRNFSALYNSVSLDILSNKYPSIPWNKEYFNTLLFVITEVQQNKFINVEEPIFIAGLE